MNRIKIGIQKSGRLAQDSIKVLRGAGLTFADYYSSLVEECSNAPIDIVFLRDDDIPKYVDEGILDLGIVGKNMVLESGYAFVELNAYEFGKCSLSLAVPITWTGKEMIDLSGCRIATTYPNSTKKYFEEKGIPIRIVAISGSTETAPRLGISDAIVDIVSTGTTLNANGLKVIACLYDSQAVMIANRTMLDDKQRRLIVQNLFLERSICQSISP